jgi:hypothetical protein
MKYVHPDVLDNGPAHLRANASRALLLPDYTAGMSYADAVASAILASPIASTDFTLSDEASGRKIVFAGVTGLALKSIAAGAPLHVAFTDGVNRILLVDNESSRVAIVAGQSYKIPVITYINPQPV